jgi:hypothetical protein
MHTLEQLKEGLFRDPEFVQEYEASRAGFAAMRAESDENYPREQAAVEHNNEKPDGSAGR